MPVNRRFVDSEGVHWQVYEITADVADGQPSGGWLYFFSRGVTRALTVYPDDWASMDWRGLARLCQHASLPAAREWAGPRLFALGADL